MGKKGSSKNQEQLRETRLADKVQFIRNKYLW